MEADGLGLASQEQLLVDVESCYSGAHRSRGRHSGIIIAISMMVAIAKQVDVLRKKRGTDLK
jgi:hypothetical protein